MRFRVEQERPRHGFDCGAVDVLRAAQERMMKTIMAGFREAAPKGRAGMLRQSRHV